MDSATKNKCLEVEKEITYLTKFIATQSVLSLTDGSISPKLEEYKRRLTALKAYRDLNGCVSVVEESKQEKVKELISTYQTANKNRIESESIYERNKRVFFGTVVLLFALVLISTSKKE